MKTFPSFGWALLVGLALQLPASADWVWDIENGWVNREYAGRRQTEPIIAESMALFEQGDFEGAAKGFEEALKGPVFGIQREEALFFKAESEYRAGDYLTAQAYFEQLLNEFPASTRISEVLERQYRIGLAFLHGHKRKVLGVLSITAKAKGVKILRQILDRYPGGEFADDIHFSLASFYFQEGRYMEAEKEYTILRDEEEFRESEWRSVSLYQIAKCQEAYYQGPEYDRDSVVNSFATYGTYVKEDPEGSRAPEAEARRAEIQADLAEGEFLRAQWYLERDRPRAAQIYLEDLVHKYPDSPWAAKAKELLSAPAEE